MKKISICCLLYCLLIVFLTGCYGIPIEHNYIGMTKSEVAAHLEKRAERSRWSKNRFVIEIPVIGKTCKKLEMGVYCNCCLCR